MKLEFNKFKLLILESILSEDKSRLIDRLVLPDIEDEEEKQKARDEMKAFFKRYSNYENKLDWNKLSFITYADFEKIKDQVTQTRGSQKREIALGDIKAIFKSVGDRKFEIIDENKNWLFVSPLTYEAAVYCDSSENQGGSAQWCIGYRNSNEHWLRYTSKGSLFIMAFNKNYKTLSSNELQNNLKFMIEKTHNGIIHVWNQMDKTSQFNSKDFNISKNKLNSMFDIVKEKYEEIKQETIQNIKESLKEKLKNLKHIQKIEKEYFTELERPYLTELNLPNNIIIIGDYAFSNCENLKSITISNSVASIGRGAFIHCKNLTSVNIPDGIKTIKQQTFYKCENLIKITLPDSVIHIDDGAFTECESLTEINFSKNLQTIGSYAFQWCNSLKSIILPATIKEIGKFAFFPIGKNLTSIVFKGKTMDEVKTMDNYPWGNQTLEKIITTSN